MAVHPLNKLFTELWYLVLKRLLYLIPTLAIVS